MKKIQNQLFTKAEQCYNEREVNGIILRDIVLQYRGIARHGRSTTIVICPFCGNREEVFIWSFAGGGKRCGKCNVLLASRGALAEKKYFIEIE